MKAPREDSMDTKAIPITIMVIMDLVCSRRHRRSRPHDGSRPGRAANSEIGRVPTGVQLQEA